MVPVDIITGNLSFLKSNRIFDCNCSLTICIKLDGRVRMRSGNSKKEFLKKKEEAEQQVRVSGLPVSQRGPVNPEGQTQVLGDTQVPPLLHPSSQKAENTRFH